MVLTFSTVTPERNCWQRFKIQGKGINPFESTGLGFELSQTTQHQFLGLNTHRKQLNTLRTSQLF